MGLLLRRSGGLLLGLGAARGLPARQEKQRVVQLDCVGDAALGPLIDALRSKSAKLQQARYLGWAAQGFDQFGVRVLIHCGIKHRG